MYSPRMVPRLASRNTSRCADAVLPPSGPRAHVVAQAVEIADTRLAQPHLHGRRDGAGGDAGAKGLERRGHKAASALRGWPPPSTVPSRAKPPVNRTQSRRASVPWPRSRWNNRPMAAPISTNRAMASHFGQDEGRWHALELGAQRRRRSAAAPARVPVPPDARHRPLPARAAAAPGALLAQTCRHEAVALGDEAAVQRRRLAREFTEGAFQHVAALELRCPRRSPRSTARWCQAANDRQAVPETDAAVGPLEREADVAVDQPHRDAAFLGAIDCGLSSAPGSIPYCSARRL